MSWGIGIDSNDNIFNVGYYMKSHSLIPSFWKNNKRINLSRPSHGDGEAKYIEIKGDKKIIAGTVMAPNNFLGYITKPAYWINGARSTCNIGSLDEGWQFQFGEDSKWYSAKVPGCVHLDLLNHKLIPDPFIDLNENEVKWVADRDWDYRLVFVPKKDLSAKSFRKLCFYGIDTYATVILNGQKIIEADNMFCKWEKNV